MKRIELANRELTRILDQSPNSQSRLDRRAVVTCLKDITVPAIHEMVDKPFFQKHVLWAIHTLKPGAETSERKLIESLRTDLRRFAKELLKLADKKMVQRKLAELFPPVEQVSKETVQITKKESVRTILETIPVDFVNCERSQVERVAQDEIDEFVEPDDFFSPKQRIFKFNNGELIQSADLILAYNPELHPIGNFIVNCLLKRIEDCIEPVKTLYIRCRKAVAETNRAYEKNMVTLKERWDGLQQQRSHLQSLLKHGDENRLRTSCTILLQIYVAYRPKHDFQTAGCVKLEWLGLSESVIAQARQQIAGRMRILEMNPFPGRYLGDLDFQVDDTTRSILEHTGVAIDELSLVNQQIPVEDTSLNSAVAAGGLVIRVSDETVFWEKKEIKGITGVRFNFLLVLARRAKRFQPLTELDLDPDRNNTSSNWLSNRKGRLDKVLLDQNAGSLMDKIHNRPKNSHGSSDQSYKLDLDPNQIHLFEEGKESAALKNKK